ncbi:MAG: HAD-IB family phosphatase, partial [Candidatus Eisenbacteria bacterium]|nr:HAD-IB family phosphatase [Candidatus Eisenbacteria bacterium]
MNFRFPEQPGTFLIDFDGTVSLQDVGNGLFRTFTGGDWVQVVELWKAGEISGRECLIRECGFARATYDQVIEFADQQEIDPHFASFVQEARARGWRVRIVSDGLEVYITRILSRYGIEVPVEANRLRVVGDRFCPIFPFAGAGCGRCGNCKQRAVEEARHMGPVVFIGDGMSDRCGAEHAEHV